MKRRKLRNIFLRIEICLLTHVIAAIQVLKKYIFIPEGFLHIACETEHVPTNDDQMRVWCRWKEVDRKATEKTLGDFSQICQKQKRKGEPLKLFSTSQ